MKPKPKKPKSPRPPTVNQVLTICKAFGEYCKNWNTGWCVVGRFCLEVEAYASSATRVSWKSGEVQHTLAPNLWTGCRWTEHATHDDKVEIAATVKHMLDLAKIVNALTPAAPASGG